MKRLIAVLAAGLSLAPFSAHALADTVGQTEHLGVAGGVSIELAQSSIDFGTVVAGNSISAGTGDVTFINTTGDGQAWSATVAATDLVTSGFGTTATTCHPSDGCISFGNEYYECDVAGCALAPSGPTFQNPPVNFSGTDTQPGESMSDPVTILSGQGTDQGSFVLSGASIHLRVPGAALPAADDPTGGYFGTLQYTITG